MSDRGSKLTARMVLSASDNINQARQELGRLLDIICSEIVVLKQEFGFDLSLNDNPIIVTFEDGELGLGFYAAPNPGRKRKNSVTLCVLRAGHITERDVTAQSLDSLFLMSMHRQMDTILRTMVREVPAIGTRLEQLVGHGLGD